MASREQLRIIRAARTGDANAQLALGRHYLFGGSGLPKNMATALHWLDRAALQQVPEAWILIGTGIPFDVARHHADDKSRLLLWYERAFDAGVMQSGLTFARLVLSEDDSRQHASLRPKAIRVLQKAAQAGIADAQWLLAQHGKTVEPALSLDCNARPDSGMCANGRTGIEVGLDWMTCAANNGVVAARYALADRAWASADYAAFLHWSLPVARGLVGSHRAATVR